MITKQTCDLLLHQASVLTEQMDIASHVSIAVSNGRILSVLPEEDALLTYHPKELVDSQNLLWMPGLVDGHMHTGQQLLRGRILDALPMIWTRIMLPFESTLTEEKMTLSSELAALEMIKSGTTGFIDAGSYFMEAAAKTYLHSGLRGVLSHSTMDQGNLPPSIAQTAQEALKSTDDLFDLFHGQGNLKVYYSLRSLISCSRELIEGAFARAGERHTFVQAHMNEYPNEINYHLEHYQKRPLEYLDSLHVLSPSFLSAHSLLLSEREMDIIRNYDIKVVHCPFSNCGKGVPHTPSLLERNISAGLGSDGTAHGGMSLWNEMKIFRSVMNAVLGVPASNPVIMPAKTILSMVLKGGACLLGEKDSLGVIKEGYLADLIAIDLNQPHLLPSANLTNTLVESVNAGDVLHMMVGGKWIMKNRTVITLDEERIKDKARRFLCSN